MTFSKDPQERRHRQTAQHRQIARALDRWRLRGAAAAEDDIMRSQDNHVVELMSDDAIRAFRRNQMRLKREMRVGPEDNDSSGASGGGSGSAGTGKTARLGVLVVCYYEELDLLLSGCEDARQKPAGVWGYNEESVKYLPEDSLDPQVSHTASENVTNRVAGMTLKHTFADHKDSVSGIQCIYRDGRHWMVSTGWDRRLCVTDLKLGRIHDVFRNSTQILNAGGNNSKGYYVGSKEELAADGIILDLEYCPERNEIAYASADKSAYIRKFSSKGDEMFLQAVLIGHEAEVTKVIVLMRGNCDNSTDVDKMESEDQAVGNRL
ncbi:hypothetical protein HDU83_008843 [Entophlyctis luteolus]|nr:hypothetical protein HDU83_008843 [Entophlyctis luteolus]